MSRRRNLMVLSTIGLVPNIYIFLQLQQGQLRYSILASALISYAGLVTTKWLVPIAQGYNLKAGLFGYDINKRGSEAGEKKIPEALGLVVGVVYLVCIICFQQVHFYGAKGGLVLSEDDTTDWLVDYNAALATICFMLFLGFADDVLDIRWRVKLILPAVASLPLLVAYSGGTGIATPKFLQDILGIPGFLELGILYKVYMVLLTVFSTNSINILAGVNGLEVGQTYVISCAVVFYNLLELSGPAGEIASTRNGHLFSIFTMAPLATTSFALLCFNWYPAQVFVGDTYTYFAGMTVAVAGILGHFSEILLIFLIPQVFNFVYSVPQLFKWVPCPRHRLARYEPETRLLHATPNWNLINLTLRVFGPCTEEMLCARILAMQVASCGLGFFCRWMLAT
ncbi:hypothetical protein BSKO_00796 [Bryopsis sp. KO-2023]|nr:hypothetical protein BSKO_00796 [Bryopsis sp. KO-2023]